VAVDIFLLHQKAAGIVSAIEAMSAPERQKRPMEPFALDFNKLRAMVLAAKPDLAEVLPAEIQIVDLQPRASYGEILAYAKQIENFTNEPSYG
jgi:hypothetical protein